MEQLVNILKQAVTYPDDDKMYNWDEATTNWKEVI